MRLENLGLIGNCQISALVAATGEIAWSCLPRFDSEPVFSSLLDPDGGSFIVTSADGEPGVQRYLPNTNVLETTFTSPEGSFRVLDFAPRFYEHARMHRPTTLMRIVEPIDGAPRVVVRCAPRLGWSKQTPTEVRGSHHVSYEGFASHLRLTTDLPLAHLDGRPFLLTARRHLVLTWGHPVEESLPALCDRFLRETVRYWQTWVKHCDVPPLYQAEVIRSALALKLHVYEDTGAIVASMTTSIPESPGSGRTWDYRYCWLRDAYYALNAFRLLGHFEERENFVNYLLNIASNTPDLELAPLYRVDGRSDLDESILTSWRGFNGEQPVRIGNGAAVHRQNDIFGEMVLALAPVFVDERFGGEATRETLSLIERLSRKAVSLVGVPDAGIWEYRTEWVPQTFSSLMCWAAADRMAKIAARRAPTLANEFAGHARSIHDEIVAKAWNERLGAFASTHGGDGLDASLLQMVSVRFLPMSDPRLASTVDAIAKGLAHDGWLLRYAQDDGFGVPSVAFIICTFWLIEALAKLGRMGEARALMNRALGALSPLGLLAEDFDPTKARLWGNFPQAYSHVGLIHAAFSASPSWDDVI